MTRLGVGIVGCGNIAPAYLRNLTSWKATRVVRLADWNLERAQALGAEFGVAATGTVEELLADPEVGLVLNLTPPTGHFEVAEQALAAGKHVYNEKPLALDREEGVSLVESAAAAGVRLGGAPDTVLGAGIQTCRQLLDAGVTGAPIGFNAFMMCPGHEDWHPDPEFYYQTGGGPLFDMGPYYLSALVTLLGPVRRVSGASRTTWAERTVQSGPKRGRTLEVQTPTHIVAVLEFDCGVIGQLTTSFDVSAHTLPPIELYCTEGTLAVPDPNGFGGPVKIATRADREWRDVPLRAGYTENARGVGVLDMALALRDGRDHRASGELAAHVLDVMDSALESAETGWAVDTVTSVKRPAPMPEGPLR